MRNWLKRADVKLKHNLYKYTWFDYVSDSHTITDFDVQVDADSFYLQEYGGITYIYWLSTVDKTDEDAPDVYRMMATYYNPSTDSMSEVFVLAELCLPDGLKPSRIYIGENGTGYCFLTGFGTLSPKNPHHRPSQAKKAAVPGMLAGGPNQNLEDPYAQNVLTGTAPALCYADSDQAFSLNEVTIYWNSPLVFLFAYVTANG